MSAKPIWMRIPAGFVRAVLAGHSALGLAFAALIYLVCFSGTAAVLIREFDRWEQPDAPMIQTVRPEAVQRALQAGVSRAKHVEHIYLVPPQEFVPHFLINIDAEGGDLGLNADAQGAIAGEDKTPWTEFIQDLHIYLHLPPSWGIFLVGLTGVALLSSLLSGLFAHPRIFRDAFHLRWGGPKRLQEADLHNRIGVWALPFHVVVSLTGALLGLTTVILAVLAFAFFKGDMEKAYALFLPPEPVADSRPAPLPDLVPMLATVSRRAPGTVPTLVAVEDPGTRGQNVLIIADRSGGLSRGENYVFDGSGKLLQSPPPDGGTLGAKIIQAISSLHFGWFGGWPVKIAYVLLGVGLTALTSSGVAIWLARRRDKGRPAPGWERIWIAWVWSQPAAYAASAFAAVLALSADPLAVWGIATLACLATASLWNPRQISTGLRLAAAALLTAVAATHGAIHANAMGDAMGWIMDGFFVALALLLAGTVLLQRRALVTAAKPATEGAAS